MDIFKAKPRSIEEEWLRSLGRKSKEEFVVKVLKRAWAKPFTTKSDFAREEATIVGMLAENGCLTLRKDGGGWGATWRITADGFVMLSAIMDNLANAVEG